jgi:ABC-type ATPase with predicted acetyltransferase domain
MTQCEANNHRLEFQEDSQGVAIWRCLDCGETIQQYQDTQGG